MAKIVVIARILVKEEFLDDVYTSLTKLHKKTHENDEGLIQYELHRDLIDRYSFTFIETWESEEYLDIHSNKEHFKEFTKEIDGKTDGVLIQRLEKLNLL